MHVLHMGAMRYVSGDFWCGSGSAYLGDEKRKSAAGSEKLLQLESGDLRRCQAFCVAAITYLCLLMGNCSLCLSGRLCRF